MKKPPEVLVVRQHDETQIPEVCGMPCSAFHVCCSLRDPVEVSLLYLKLDATWHRFFLDAWLLFWREGHQPDWEDELLDGEEWVDWGELLGVVGVALSEVVMEDSVLTMRFENSAEIVLRHTFDDVTSIIRLKPGDKPAAL